MANSEKRTLMEWAKIIGIIIAVVGGGGAGGVSLFGQQAASDSLDTVVANIAAGAKDGERRDKDIDTVERRVGDAEQNISALSQAQGTIIDNQKGLTTGQRELRRGQDTMAVRINDILWILRSMQADSMVPRDDTTRPPPHRGPRRP